MRTRWWTALVVPALAAACSGGDGPEQTEVAGIPVLEGSTSGPGTDLGAGFTVAEGSVLVGTTFPAGDADVPNRGFVALLLATGSLPEVFDAYNRQAAAIGIRLGPSVNVEAQSACWEDDHLRAFVCNGSGNRGDNDVPGPTVSVTAFRAPATGDRAPLSHVLLRYDDAGVEPPADAPPADARPRFPGEGPPVPDEWPDLAREGEGYEPGGQGQQPLRVPEGVELVTHPMVPAPVCLTGSTAVFRSEHEVEDAIDRLVPDDAEALTLDARTERGSDLLEVRWEVGSRTYHASAAARRGESTYVLIDVCLD